MNKPSNFGITDRWVGLYNRVNLIASITKVVAVCMFLWSISPMVSVAYLIVNILDYLATSAFLNQRYKDWQQCDRLLTELQEQKCYLDIKLAHLEHRVTDMERKDKNPYHDIDNAPEVDLTQD